MRVTNAHIVLGCALIVALAALLTFVPAPVYLLWLVALLASELGPHLVIVSIVLLILAARGLRSRTHLRLNGAAALLAVFGLVAAAAQTATILGSSVARGENISLLDCLLFNRPSTAGIVKFKGKQYARRDSGALYLDIYQPSVTGPHPAVLVIHGGSWRGGHRSDFEQYDYWLAGLGYTVFDLDYRLVKSGVHFPSPEKDIELAVDWIAQHAGELGVDTRRLAFLGRSAGAQLAMVAAYKTALAGDGKARCVVALYGPTDLAWDYDNPILPDIIDSRDVLSAYLGGTPTQVPDLYSQASACALVSDATPPTILIHGGRDQIVSDRNVGRLVPHLQEHRVAFDYLHMPWANHGFDWHFSGLSSQISRKRIERFLKGRL